MFYVSCIFCWIAFAEKHDSFLIWGSSGKSHWLCFGVSPSIGFNSTLSFSHTLRETLPCLLGWEVNLSPHCFSKSNITLASIIWSTAISTGHLLPVQQILQHFHSPFSSFQCDQVANCLSVPLFLWKPNKSPQNSVNCSKNSNFRHTIVLQYSGS